MVAIATPISRVIAKESIAVEGPVPRSAAGIAMTHRSTMSALRAPSLAVKSVPNTDVSASMSTGGFASAEIPYASRERSR